MANAWLVIAAGDDRQHGGNDGYDDDPAAVYRWDSTVANHAAIGEGDAIVLWDKHAVIGASVIDRIDDGDGMKNVYRCSNCGQGSIKRRKRLQPEWRCFTCSTTFDGPTVEQQPVHTYATHHAICWVDLSGILDGKQLRQLAEKPRSQLSLRRLDWERFRAAVEATLPGDPLRVVEHRVEQIRGGHRQRTIRARLGQAAFRNRLLARYGSACAITGPSPADALEACHLYSYASIEEHHDYGGLLLRRDIHRLFDLGQIAIEPQTLTVDVRPALLGYGQYADLHRRPLLTRLDDRHRQWLGAHWAQHRGGRLRAEDRELSSP